MLKEVIDEGGHSSYISVRLTIDPAVDRQPAVASNGKEIAFVRGTGTAREIYVMDAKDDDGDGEGDNLRRLTNNGAADLGPAWSPGGRRIVFQFKLLPPEGRPWTSTGGRRFLPTAQ